MALSLAGLAPLTSGYYQGKDELMRRQMLAYQQQKQQQTDAGLVQWAQALANNQQQPPPQPLTPPPGQQSQPMQPPQGGGQPPQQGMMPPGQMPQGQMGLPRQQMGPPPQQAPQAPQVKPYTAPQPPQIATSQQQMPQAQALGPPPQGQSQGQSPVNAPDLMTMASILKKQGASGMTLYSALMAHQQFLSVEGKQQLDQVTMELKKRDEENKALTADARSRDADTHAADAARRQETADGGNAMSAAKIEQMKALAKAAYARAEKAANSGKPADPADVSLLARGVAAGKIDPSKLSTKGGHRERVIEEALRINPDYDMKDFNSENALDVSGARAAGAAGAKTAIASGAAQGGADILVEAAKKVPRGSFRSLNKAILEGETEANDPDTGAYLTAINTFVNEYSRATNPSGVATKSDKDHARELIAASDSQEALEAKVGVMRKEMQRGKQAPRDVADDLRKDRKRAGGASELSDQDKQALDWANANPKDPRAAQIKKRLGM